jgi:hydrogenase expression/formation protein HypD
MESEFESIVQQMYQLADKIGREVYLMEVCGTHTMSAFRSGLHSLMPSNVKLLSGPGCPVCVTPDSYIEKAIAIAFQPNVIITTFGDMVRVPSPSGSLEKARAKGAHVEVVYSPADALKRAVECPQMKVVFLGVGFETTAPLVAWTIREAFLRNLTNYSVLCSNKTIPEAMDALMSDGTARIDGFMCPGHVSAIIGANAYRWVCEKYHVPMVISGFEPSDMVRAINMLLQQILEQRAEVEIQYKRAVDYQGNLNAMEILNEVFERSIVEWRGLGFIDKSGFAIRKKYSAYDAERKFPDICSMPSMQQTHGCRCGDVLKGAISPPLCPLFSVVCTPDNPRGPCMVSSEGTCAAYYKYARIKYQHEVRKYGSG